MFVRMRAASAVALSLFLGLVGCEVTPEFELKTLSSRPDMVTGGDVLVRVAVPAEANTASVKVLLNDRDVTSAFRSDPAGSGGLIGLVGGLQLGDNVLRTTYEGREAGTPLTLTNHPVTGPLFYSPAQQPFICQTQEFPLYPGGPLLGPPIDTDCSVATRVDYLYRAANNTWKPFDPNGARPSDLTQITTNENVTVPFIVRLETGTANRSIYQTAMLHDPAAGPTPDFTQRSSGWNGRLVYAFGGGCNRGWYRQGNTVGPVLDQNILARGYATASASLNVFGNNCQDVTASETMAMVKERFIESYGQPRYTMGWGLSGGAYQQHQIVDNYPGLLDGILPGASFPEVLFATVYFITDARLLVNYFDNTAPGTFTQEQQRRVAGFLNYATLRTQTVNEGALRINATYFCPPVLPESQRYHPVTNRTGARCDVYSHTVEVLGRDPATGFARRPLDNVGVQYGLAALNAGHITVDQFLDLNERIGGYDVDGNFQPQRTVADLAAVREAYQTGRLTNGGGGLKDVPIIDYRAYSDDTPLGDIHLRYHSFSMRERLKAANGNADNQVMLVEDLRYGLYSSSSPMLMFALEQMDQWLANISADASSDPQPVKVVRNKPATLREGCNTRDPNPTFIAEQQVRSSGRCEELYPSSPAPREVAGAPVINQIIKCQLKPISPSDYAVAFTSAQQARLQAIFPQGVCDWSRPGVEQQGLRGSWLRF